MEVMELGQTNLAIKFQEDVKKLKKVSQGILSSFKGEGAELKSEEAN